MNKTVAITIKLSTRSGFAEALNGKRTDDTTEVHRSFSVLDSVSPEAVHRALAAAIAELHGDPETEGEGA